MIVNATKLDGELRAAGIPLDGVGFNPDGSPRLDLQASATPAQVAQAQAILAAHDPSTSREDKLRALGRDPLVVALLLIVQQGPGAPAWARALVAKVLADVAGIA